MPRQWQRRVVADHPQGLQRCQPGHRQRQAIDQQLVTDHAQRVDIAARIRRALARRLLGAHVGRGAEQRAGLRQGAADAELLADAEVQHLGLAVCGDQDVGRLQIAMDHAARVGVLHRIGDARQQLQPRRARKARGMPRQVHALDVFHRQERVAVGIDIGLDHLGDARVRQAREQFGLAREAGAQPRLVGQCQALDCHLPPRRGLLREIDHAHATAAQLAQHAVTADLARQGRWLLDPSSSPASASSVSSAAISVSSLDWVRIQPARSPDGRASAPSISGRNSPQR